VLTAIKGWRQQNQNKALANLNVMAGDFLGDPDGDIHWPIVQTAIELNQTAPAPQLTEKSFVGDYKEVSCTGPQENDLQMMAYPLTEGKVGLDSMRSQLFPGELLLRRQEFPPGNFNVRVDCTTDQGVTSSLTVLTSDLLGTACPYGVGRLIMPNGGNEIDVLAPDCARRHIPNPATLERIKYTWVSNVQKLPPADFNNLDQGSDIPDLTTDANEFTLAMDDIYGAKCFSLQLPIGTLFSTQNADGTPLYVVLAGGCAFRAIRECDDAASDRESLQPNGAIPAAVSGSVRLLLWRSGYFGLHDQQGWL
jgi:hypothetical protein